FRVSRDGDRHSGRRWPSYRRYPDLLPAMTPAFHPRHVGLDPRRELHHVQVPPAGGACCRTTAPASRTPDRGTVPDPRRLAPRRAVPSGPRLRPRTAHGPVSLSRTRYSSTSRMAPILPVRSIAGDPLHPTPFPEEPTHLHTS